LNTLQTEASKSRIKSDHGGRFTENHGSKFADEAKGDGKGRNVLWGASLKLRPGQWQRSENMRPTNEQS